MTEKWFTTQHTWVGSVAGQDCRDPRCTSGKEPACQWRRHKRQWVQSLGQEDPLEESVATHSNILAWRIPWTEESSGLHSLGLQRIGYDWSDLTRMQDGVSCANSHTCISDQSHLCYQMHNPKPLRLALCACLSNTDKLGSLKECNIGLILENWLI